ncbi:MAG TPA: hypothetical protein VFS43_24025 [Polyangiaceae bacterium]|nr:hypothetical protein [Polyangiaceae bacterium]
MKANGETNRTVVRWHDEHTLEFVYRGDVTAAEMGRVLAEYRRLRAGRPERFQIVDVEAMNWLDPGSSEVVFELLRDFAAGGGREVVVIVTEANARMRALSLGFRAQVPARVFATRAAALARLASLAGRAD